MIILSTVIWEYHIFHSTGPANSLHHLREGDTVHLTMWLTKPEELM